MTCPLNSTQSRRYDRQVILPEIGEEGQSRLLAARVLIVGAGGLGSPALLYLAAAGIGTLGIADADRIELSNLPRQILYEEADLNRPKAESARDRVGEMNSGIRIVSHPERVTAENAESLIAQYDIIADGSDNFPTRFLLAEQCFRAGKPLVSAAVQGWQGQVTTFTPYLGIEHPCYRCMVGDEPPAPNNCVENGVLGPVAGVIGSMQAQEIVKLILGLPSLSGSLLRYDGLTSTLKHTKLPKDKNCRLCSHSRS